MVTIGDNPFDLYIEFSKFRVNTFNSIKSKRKAELVFKDIDKTLTRIANSIHKGYTLANRFSPFDHQEYRPYPYFEITWSEIDNPRNMTVTITRGVFSITITQDSWSKFHVWATKWKAIKPVTLEECDDINFYTRWW